MARNPPPAGYSTEDEASVAQMTSIELERGLRSAGVIVPTKGSPCTEADAAKVARGAAPLFDHYCQWEPGFAQAYQATPPDIRGELLGGQGELDQRVCAAVRDLFDRAKEANDAVEAAKGKVEEVEHQLALQRDDGPTAAKLRADLKTAQDELTTRRAASDAANERVRDTARLRDVCGRTIPVAGGATAVLTAAVGGLGAFLAERAKQEVIAYAVHVLGREICKEGGSVRLALTAEGEFALERSCSSAFPSGTSGVIDYAAFSDGRFQRAFARDVESLPRVAVRFALSRVPGLSSRAVEVMSTYAQVVMGELSPLAHAGTFHFDGLLIRIDAHLQARLSSVHDCAVAAPTAGSALVSLPPECGLLLATRLAAEVERTLQAGTLLDERAVVTNAANAFCATWGTDEACLGAPDDVAAAIAAAIAKLEDLTPGEVLTLLDQRRARQPVWLDAVALVARYRDGLVELQRAARAIGSEARRNAIVAGLRAILPPALELARRRYLCPLGTPSPEEDDDARRKREAKAEATCAARERAAIDTLLHGVDAAIALSSQDPNEAATALRSLFALPTVSEALGDKGVRAIAFALQLGSAETADEAKEIFEAAAEPLGSYRIKYDGDFVVSVNGFVGPRIGGLVLLQRNTTARDRSSPRLDPVPLTGPVGIDLSWRCARQHLGLAVVALDPLGMITIDEEDQTRVDWGAVLTPGLLLRWGIQGSPLDLYLTGQFQPLRRPAPEVTQNGSEVLAYDGTFAFGGGLAVDIPILVLHSR